MASPFINYFMGISNLHKMCTEDKLNENFRETIQNFRECFEVVHELFDVSETLKIHVILNHYSDYFEMTGKIFKETNGEHHEALHHTLKTMEKNKGLYMRKNMAVLPTRKKTHQAISFRNVLSAGFTPKSKLRIRRSKKNSESESETESSQNIPQKRFKKTVLSNFIDRIDE